MVHRILDSVAMVLSALGLVAALLFYALLVIGVPAAAVVAVLHLLGVI